jgi:hypothetical protein
VGGPIDPRNETNDLVMSVFGGMSKGERNRIKIRVKAAIGAQAKDEGRFLGGRPPYGYAAIGRLRSGVPLSRSRLVGHVVQACMNIRAPLTLRTLGLTWWPWVSPTRGRNRLPVRARSLV